MGERDAATGVEAASRAARHAWWAELWDKKKGGGRGGRMTRATRVTRVRVWNTARDHFAGDPNPNPNPNPNISLSLSLSFSLLLSLSFCILLSPSLSLLLYPSLSLSLSLRPGAVLPASPPPPPPPLPSPHPPLSLPEGVWVREVACGDVAAHELRKVIADEGLELGLERDDRRP